ncbi:MAG: ParB/RepB/Spo0J family partition protein [Pseudomonadota bacterium]
MAKPKKGLGRGLSALLADASPTAHEEDLAAAGAGSEAAPIEFLAANPKQPRRIFDDAALEELAASIRRQGLLQPIVVRPTGGEPKYEIVAGERRWRAAQRAGLHEVPIVVRRLDDQQAAEIALVENVQRTDLNPLEEAAAYQRLADEFGHAHEEIADAVGKSRSHVANLIRLLKLPASVRDKVNAGALSMGHARAILSAPDPAALAERVVKRGLSVRETERLAKADAEQPAGGGDKSSGRGPAPLTEKEIRKDADTRALEADLAASLGLAVDLAHGSRGGVLSIKYATLEQLDDVCRRLLDSSV